MDPELEFEMATEGEDDDEEARRFFEDLTGESEDDEAVQRRATPMPTRSREPARPTGRPGPSRPAPPPTRVVVTTVPTFAPPSTTITAESVVDAGVYLLDPDPAVARQVVEARRIYATKTWLAANPGGSTGRKTSGPAAADPRTVAAQDRLVDGLVAGGFPVAMWAGSIALAEIEGWSEGVFMRSAAAFVASASRPNPALATAPVRRWLEVAANVAGLATQGAPGPSVSSIAAATRGTTPQAVAVSALGLLVQASVGLHVALARTEDRRTAATTVSRLTFPDRVALPYLAVAAGADVEALRNALTGRVSAVPSALRATATRIAARTRQLQAHLRAPMPDPFGALAQW